MAVVRRKGSTTRFPGVKRLGEGKYHLRWKAVHPKTGRTIDHERIIDDCPNAAEAARRRDEMRTQTSGEAAPSQRMRLAEYSISWLAGKRKTVKPSTLDRYARAIAHHIIPAFGDHYLDALSHQDLVVWRDAQTAEAATVNGWMRVLKTMLADATVALDLPRNPALRVTALPESRYDEEAPNCLTAPQLSLFLEAARKEVPTRWYPLFATLAFTAMRVGEATALKWSDVIEGEDDGPGIIRVQRAHWRGRIGTTKTDRQRTVPLPRELRAILKDHRRGLIARQAPGLEDDWVFPNDKGEPTASQVVRKPLLRVLSSLEREGAGVDHLTVHGLRRTMNNLLRQVAQGEVVRSVTGHVTERMTEHYSHIGAEEKATAVARVVSLVRVAPLKVGVLVGVEVLKR